MLPRLQASNKQRRVATYMAGFEGIEPLEVLKVAPPHQPGAQWPVFLFELGGGDNNSQGGSTQSGNGGDVRSQSAAASSGSGSVGGGNHGGSSTEGSGKKWIDGNVLGSLISHWRSDKFYQWTFGALLVAAATTTVLHRWNMKSLPVFRGKNR